MCDETTAVEDKLRIWDLQLLSNNMTLFPKCEKEMSTDVEEIQLLQK
jgi:hypothetical protein